MFKINNLLSNSDIRIICHRLMANQCIQLIEPVEIDCKDKNKSKVHIMYLLS